MTEASQVGNVAETLSGTLGNDALIGGAGNDLLKGGGGDDYLNGGIGDDYIEGRTGVDHLVGGGGYDRFIFFNNDSNVAIGGSGNDGTITGYDIIEDFKVGDGTHISEWYDIAGAVSIAADAPDVDGNTSALKVGGAFISSHKIETGVVEFSHGGASFSTALEISTESEIAAAVNYLSRQDLGGIGSTVAFDVGADTFMFTQGSVGDGQDSTDTVVRLEDVQVDALTTIASAGEFDLFIA